MTTATVHHLPTAEHLRTLDEQARDLTEGQWVRITWHDKSDGCRGTVEGNVRRPSNLQRSLFVGGFCLATHEFVNINVTSIDTTPRPVLDMDDLAPLMEDWAAASVELEQKPIGRTKTGDNTAEQNALFDCETAVRKYLRGVTV